MGISTRLKLARLVVQVPDAPAVLPALAGAAFTGGADAVVLVEDLSTAVSDESAVGGLDALRSAAGTHGLTGYLGRPVRAAQLAPDLVVLADDEADAARTRALVGPHARIGRRCNTAAEVDAALADAAVEFLFVGPGLDHIRHAASVAPAHDPASKPWFAQGGVTERTLDGVLEAGAMRVVVDHAVVDAEDPASATLSLKDRLRAAWAADPRMEDVTASAFGTQDHLSFPPTPSGPATDLTL